MSLDRDPHISITLATSLRSVIAYYAQQYVNIYHSSKKREPYTFQFAVRIFKGCKVLIYAKIYKRQLLYR